MFLLLLGALSLLHSVTLIYEPFDANAIGTRWFVSKEEKFNGTWALENRAADYSNGTIQGIVTKSLVQYHAISMKNQVDATGNAFVLQFEHKIQATSFSCGGSYIKVLNEDFNPPEFNNKSPFVIMFGPDKCGETNQVQFIYKTQNPLSKYWGEHKLKTKVPGLYDNITHLYTLVINQDDTFEIKVDGQIKANGSLHNETLFDPPFEPSKLIPDTSDHKPADWVDAEEIPDVNDTKPADWDETAPPTIPDPNATKPEDWKEDEPLQILDATATKPEDWNEDEDGPYKQALVDNPYCVDHGCGKWSPPQIKNPAYKGKWKPKMVKNPAFKGKWKPRDVANPYHFVPEKTLHQVGTIYGLGFELISPVEQWFGNIFVGDTVSDAEDLAKSRWSPVNQAEVAYKKSVAAAAAEASSVKKKLPQLVGNLTKREWTNAWDIAKDFYFENPLVTVLVCVVFVVSLIGLLICCCCCCCDSEESSGAKKRITKTRKLKKAENTGDEEEDDEKDGKEDKDNEKEEEEEEEEEEEGGEQEEEEEDEGKKGRKEEKKSEKASTKKSASPVPTSSSSPPASTSSSSPNASTPSSGIVNAPVAAEPKAKEKAKSDSPVKERKPQEQPKPQPVTQADEEEAEAEEDGTASQKKRKGKKKTQHD